MSKKLQWGRGGPGKATKRIWAAIGSLVVVTTVVTVGSTSAASAASAACNPDNKVTRCVSVQPTVAAPGQTVTVTGTGWLGWNDVPITFGFTPQGDIVADPVPSSTGTFAIQVTVPKNAPVGQTIVEAYYGGGAGAETFFTVTPVSTPSPPPSTCPSVLFLGAHGVNEGSSTNWGGNIEAVWTAFHKQLPAAIGKAANYPYVQLSWPKFNALQALGLQSKAESAAQALETQMYNQFTLCGARTRFVLAGFSLGAWVVDLTLRNLNSTVAGRLILAQVAGAGVLGDPAFPVHLCKTVGIYKKCREGVATYFGRGYSTNPDYLHNGLSKRFLSICLSYSDTYLDPVCGGYGLSSLFSTANIKLHETGYQKQSGAAAYLGGVLAGYAKQ